MDPNRKYKDSVFTLLFSDPDRLRELYNALAGTHYDRSTQITINTLSDALFFGRTNDLSFTIDDKLVVLIEHQSTVNPNMSIRLLSYIARIYEKLVETRRVYSKTALVIPRPEFIVLYNGIDEYPDEDTLRLSDHFEKTENPDTIDLDLVVRVYNINSGRNPGLERKSRSLGGYAGFIAKIREELRAGQTLPHEEGGADAVKGVFFGAAGTGGRPPVGHEGVADKFIHDSPGFFHALHHAFKVNVEPADDVVRRGVSKGFGKSFGGCGKGADVGKEHGPQPGKAAGPDFAPYGPEGNFTVGKAAKDSQGPDQENIFR